MSGFISYSKGKCPDLFSISNLPCGHEQVIKRLLVAEVPSIKQDDWTSSRSNTVAWRELRIQPQLRLNSGPTVYISPLTPSRKKE